MHILFQVDQVAAFRRGINTSAQHVTLEVDPSTLGDAERTLLASRLAHRGAVCARDTDGKFRRGPYVSQDIPDIRPGDSGNPIKLVMATGPTLEELLDAIRTEEAVIAQERARKDALDAEAAAQRTAATLAVWEGRTTLKRHAELWAFLETGEVMLRDRRPYDRDLATGNAAYVTQEPAWSSERETDEEVLARPEVVAWVEGLRAANVQARADAEEAARERLARALATKVRERVEAEALADAKARQVDAWVAAHGTPSQQARHAEGLLPLEEVLAALRDDAFTPLANESRYQRITAKEVCTCEYDTCGIACETDPAPSLSAAAYDELVRLRGLLPGVTITPLLHTCTSDTCAETLERLSAEVVLTVGAFTFTRHYALEGNG